MSMLLLPFMLAALPDGLIAEMDALWASRNGPNNIPVAKTVIKKLAPHAKEFEAAWRIARAHCWWAERKPYYADLAFKMRHGQLAMKHAKQSIALQPKRVEGYYYMAWGVGQWSTGLSVPKALWKGAEGKITRAMKRATQIDRSFDDYGILRMWGRFHHALPWPKYDGDKAVKYFKEARGKVPHNLRGYVYLAEALLKNDKSGKACAVVDQGLKIKPIAAREPDWHRFKGFLKKLKASGCKKLLEDL